MEPMVFRPYPRRLECINVTTKAAHSRQLFYNLESWSIRGLIP